MMQWINPITLPYQMFLGFLKFHMSTEITSIGPLQPLPKMMKPLQVHNHAFRFNINSRALANDVSRLHVMGVLLSRT